jgi:hypothetical protein
MLIIIWVNALLADVVKQEHSKQAIVRIIANYCPNDAILPCSATEFSGSGLLIDSRGIILTSLEVVSGTQGYADDFEVIAHSGVTQTYRAVPFVIDQAKELALLLIYYDNQKQLVVNKDFAFSESVPKLPILSFSDTVIQNGSEVKILQMAADELVGIAATVNDTTMTLPITLEEGMAGSPVLWEDEVVGIIIGKPNENPVRVRSIAEIRNLSWPTGTQQIWVKDIQIATHSTETTTVSVQITATIHALDQISKSLAFLAYVFNEKRQPLPSPIDNSNQLAAHKVYSPQRFADVQSVVLTQSLAAMSLDLSQLRLRFLVWDVESERVLWRDNRWYRFMESSPITPTTPPPVTPTIPITPTRPSLECVEDMAPVNNEFCMDIYEVTNAEYQKCVDSSREVCSRPQPERSWSRSSYYGIDEFWEYPVVYITWEQAKTFCKYKDKRLPTAEEWSAAVKMLTVPFEEQNIKADDTLPKGSNTQDVSTNGIYDLAGNVREWTNDRFQSPGAPTPSQNIIVKGNSFQAQKDLALSQDPMMGDYDIGFRCVASNK